MFRFVEYMHFLYPYFLFALASLAIPIVVHLFNFRRYKKVFFSNTSFLKEVIEESNNAQKLKRILILLSRCLALLFMVLAFAQPVITKNDQIQKGRTAVSIFIDNSFSMESIAKDRTLLNKAKEVALDIVSSYDNDVSFQLITQDLTGKQQRLLSKEECIDAIKRVVISPTSYSLEEVRKKQIDALDIESFDSKDIYTISDFQTHAGLPLFDTLHTYKLVHISAVQSNNLFIDSVWLENPVAIKNQNNTLYVLVKNEGDQDIDKLRVNMKLNGVQKAIGELQIAANSSAIDTLYFNQNNAGWNSCDISIEDNPILFDNSYFASFYVQDKISILNITGKQTDRYISALSSFSNIFSLQQMPVAQINYGNFTNQHLLVLNNIEEISSGMQGELIKYLNQGGHIALFPAQQANITSLNSFLSSIQASGFGAATTKVNQVKSINVQSDIVKDIFENKQLQNISLPKCNFAYTSLNNRVASEQIMTLQDGSPLLTQYRIGRGIAYIFNSPLDAGICDLPLHALFAPLVFKMAIQGQYRTDIQHSIGDKRSIEIPGVPNDVSENVLYIKGNNTEFIPEQSRVNNQLFINLRQVVRLAGIYELFQPETKQQIANIALNYKRTESNMRFYTINDLETACASNKHVQIYDGNKEAISQQVKEDNEGIALWKLCIIFALLFILAEILLIRFWKTNNIA